MSEVRKFRWTSTVEGEHPLQQLAEEIGLRMDMSATGGYDVEDGKVYFVQYNERVDEVDGLSLEILQAWAQSEDDDLNEVA